MNIVIVGASDLGLHVAKAFSDAGHDVTLIEADGDKLAQSAQELDIGCRLASGANVALLSDLARHAPDLLVAASDRDELNLVICTLAKSVGFNRTMARLKSDLYFETGAADLKQLFLTDHIISPDALAASELMRFLCQDEGQHVSHFGHGSIEMHKITLPSSWNASTTPIHKLALPPQVTLSLIRRLDASDQERGHKVLFPHGSDFLKAKDEVVLFGKAEEMEQLRRFFGLETPSHRRVFIYGFSRITRRLVQRLLEAKIDVKLLMEKNPPLEREAALWAEKLPDLSLVVRTHIDKEILISEQIANYDVFIAASDDDQDNLCACLMAQDLGCKTQGIYLHNPIMTDLCQKRGISLCVSPSALAQNQILSLAAGDAISSIVSLYNEQAYVVQMHIEHTSALVGIPLSALAPSLPKELVFGVIESRGQIQIAHGESLMVPGDTVVAICHPRHLPQLKKLL